ncbi:hypothetical protein PSECIP111951_02669 [Pseudoalteromonas holothuriae]|uniref:Replication initiator protein A n=1 Tax=Pseudoalteromonas holothuriae TaxID=2963714 RepID=A0ABN8UN10_9GAMM|nr:replication initiator protein A [Pseudoalteromonas sp. CIP111951]CAH9062337.1 hypothetical protein PSECIP111951_02669 [Pseudoalteromonas sp. CIP111951]
MSQNNYADLPLLALKSDLFSMEYPVFALDGKSKDPFSTEHKGVSIQITPSVLGRATVKDKEIIIFCLSRIMLLRNSGFEVSDTITFNGYEFLTAMGRNTSGKEYMQLETALRRLAGTRITTNYKIKNRRILEDVGLIQSFTSELDGREKLFSVTLADWLIDCTQTSYILTLNRHYHLLTKPFERRVYELCKKFCGAKHTFSISLDNVGKRLGLKGTNALLKRRLSALSHVLDYRIEVDNHLLRVFRDTKVGNQQLDSFKQNQLGK